MSASLGEADITLNAGLASNEPIHGLQDLDRVDTEFSRKYPSDPFGEEMEDNARVWKVYRDEATAHDNSLLDGWNKTSDILLIFSGLFSAVCTAFIVESYKLLQPDYNEYTANALFALLSARNASHWAEISQPALSPHEYSASTSSRWINGLWFTSLVLSLCVALLCILVKQWAHSYHSRTTGSSRSLRYWARRHALLNGGLVRWYMPELVSMLPALLHASVFEFLVGLVLFLHNLDQTLAACVLGLAVLVTVLYLASCALPFIDPTCPFSTPTTTLLYAIGGKLLYYSQVLVDALMRRCSFIAAWTQAVRAWRIRAASASISTKAAAVDFGLGTAGKDADLVMRDGEKLDAAALQWLIVTSSAPEAVCVGIQAIGAITPWSLACGYIRSVGVARAISNYMNSGSVLPPLQFASLSDCPPHLARRNALDVARYARTLKCLLPKPPIRLSGLSASVVSTYDSFLLGSFWMLIESNLVKFASTEVAADLHIDFLAAVLGGHTITLDDNDPERVAAHQKEAQLRHLSSVGPGPVPFVGISALHGDVPMGLLLRLFLDQKLYELPDEDLGRILRNNVSATMVDSGFTPIAINDTDDPVVYGLELFSQIFRGSPPREAGGDLVTEENGTNAFAVCTKFAGTTDKRWEQRRILSPNGTASRVPMPEFISLVASERFPRFALPPDELANVARTLLLYLAPPIDDPGIRCWWTHQLHRALGNILSGVWGHWVQMRDTDDSGRLVWNLDVVASNMSELISICHQPLIVQLFGGQCAAPISLPALSLPVVGCDELSHLLDLLRVTDALPSPWRIVNAVETQHRLSAHSSTITTAALLAHALCVARRDNIDVKVLIEEFFNSTNWRAIILGLARELEPRTENISSPTTTDKLRVLRAHLAVCCAALSRRWRKRLISLDAMMRVHFGICDGDDMDTILQEFMSVAGITNDERAKARSKLAAVMSGASLYTSTVSGA